MHYDEDRRPDPTPIHSHSREFLLLQILIGKVREVRAARLDAPSDALAINSAGAVTGSEVL